MYKLSTEDLIVFNKLYEEYHQRFLRFANSYVRDNYVAQDITTEALMYYWENRHSVDVQLNIPGYILTVIKHKSLNYLRHIAVCEEYSEQMKNYYQWELNSRITSLESCEPYELFTTEIQEIVEATLKSLPEQTRRIFIMSRYENKSHKEIAAQLNMTTKGVEFHMSKAFKLLRINLKDYFLLFLYFF
ncbi:MAG: RNA polymerase sigma-70 factor [Bacteroides sp.]|uniref:RNA polymerase sigma-70 factor n=1 Tax=Bacteroides sp. TaxID=29523 RepID=UPI002FCC37EF